MPGGDVCSVPKPISNSSNVFIWSLFDINEPDEPKKLLVNYPCLPVQTAPLNPIRYKIWSKEQAPLHTGLPLWTHDELAQGLRHRHEYPFLLAALDKVYRSSSPNLSDPLDVYPGVHALLEEHYSEEGSVQPSPEDALNYLLDAAIDRFGYSARDVWPSTIVRLQSITGLPSCLNNNSYYVLSDDPNFPLFDAFIIELDHAKKSTILWVLQMTTSRKPGGSAKGYQKIREIIVILKDELGEEPPPKKSKMAAGQAAPEPLVQVRYLLVVPKDEWAQSQNLQWDFPKGWSQNREKNDHCGNVYCLEVPLVI